MTLLTVRPLAVVAALCFVAVPVVAQDEATEDEKPQKEYGWFNETELSLVSTRGNVDSDTFGFKNKLRRLWKKARFQFRIEGIRADSGGIRTAVATDPLDPDGDFTVVESGRVTDLDTWLVEARYDREFSGRTFWNVGTSWDKNLSAGIEGRLMVFGTIGHVWWDREDLKFEASFGVGFADRDEFIDDPRKDDRFSIFRFDWGYRNQLTKNSVFTNDWTINVSLEDREDWWSNMTSSFTVGFSNRLALRVSLQLLYNNLPALEVLSFCLDAEMTDCPGVRVTEKEPLDSIVTAGLVVSF